MTEQHAAKNWVEANFPHARGAAKATLIMVFGAGLDAGLAEAQEMVEAEIGRRLFRGALGLPMDPHEAFSTIELK